MSKTESTKKNYKIKSTRLIKRFEKETQNKYTDNPKKIIPWLVTKKPTWKAPTWRQYKSAICEYFSETGQLQAKNELFEIQCDGCRPNNYIANSSSKKAKHFSLIDEKLIEKYFVERKRNKWTLQTYCFMKATLLTGLRPCEWKSSELLKMRYKNKEIYVLTTKNAKDTNGRAHGDLRHLLLNNLSDAAIKVIKQHLLNIQKHLEHESTTATFSEYQEACRQTMKRATKDLFAKRKKRPSLYTCRHQFSANLKNAGYSLVEIAALMGHGTDETATVHYGRKSRKKGGGPKSRAGLPEAYPPEMARVKEVYVAKARNAPHNINKNNKGPSL